MSNPSISPETAVFEVTLSKLHVKDIVEASGGMFKSQSPSLEIAIGDQAFCTNRIRHGRTEASFPEVFVFKLPSKTSIDSLQARITVFNESSKGEKTDIGNGIISMRDMLNVIAPDTIPQDGSSNDFSVVLTHSLRSNKEHNKGRFSANAKVHYQQKESDKPLESSNPPTYTAESTPATAAVVGKQSEETSESQSTVAEVLHSNAEVEINSNNINEKKIVISSDSVVKDILNVDGPSDKSSEDPNIAPTSAAPIAGVVTPRSTVKDSLPAKSAADTSTKDPGPSQPQPALNPTPSPVITGLPTGQIAPSTAPSAGGGHRIELSRMSVTLMEQQPSEEAASILKGRQIALEIAQHRQTAIIQQDLQCPPMTFLVEVADISGVKVRVTIDGGSEGKPLYAAEGELSELLPIPDTPTSFTLYLSAEAAAPASTADAAIARAATPTARLDAVGVRILHVLARPPESSSNALKAERTSDTSIHLTTEVQRTGGIQVLQNSINNAPTVSAVNPVLTINPSPNPIHKREVRLGLSSTSRTKRLGAEIAGTIGHNRTSLSEPDLNKSANKIQSLWRGKRVRRFLRRRHIAAMEVQRMVRGYLTRQMEGDYRLRVRAHIETQGASSARMSRIRQRERSLRLLRSLPARDVGDLTRLEQQRAANIIQQTWRRQRARITSSPSRSSARSPLSGPLPSYTYLVRKFAKSRAGISSGKAAEGLEVGGKAREGTGEEVGDEDSALAERREKLQQHILRTLGEEVGRVEGVARRGSKSIEQEQLEKYERVYLSTHEYSIDVEAVKLAQLQRRIQAAAAKKQAAHHTHQDKDNESQRGATWERDGRGIKNQSRLRLDTSNGLLPSLSLHRDRDRAGPEAGFGARRKYQEMVDAQQKASILLQEHHAGAEEMRQRQLSRHDSLGHCRYLVEQLTRPLSLEEAREVVVSLRSQAGQQQKEHDPAGSERKEEGQADEEDWLRRDYLAKYPVHERQAHYPAPPADPFPHPYPFISQKYISSHLRTIDAVRSDRHKWGSVTVPFHDIYNVQPKPNSELNNDGTGGQESNREGDDDFMIRMSSEKPKSAFLANVANVNVRLSRSSMEGQEAKSGPKDLRPLVKQWVSGSDLEESLYWISYATQPSHIRISPGHHLPPGAKADDNITKKLHGEAGPDVNSMESEAGRGKEEEEIDVSPNLMLLRQLNPQEDQLQAQHAALRNQISAQVMSAAQRRDRIRELCIADSNRVARLATHYQQEILSMCEREGMVRAQREESEEEKRRKVRAATLIQSQARGRSARMRTAGLRAQRRVISALQTLLREIGYAEPVLPNLNFNFNHLNPNPNPQPHPAPALVPASAVPKSVNRSQVSLKKSPSFAGPSATPTGGLSTKGNLPISRNLAFSPSLQRALSGNLTQPASSPSPVRKRQHDSAVAHSLPLSPAPLQPFTPRGDKESHPDPTPMTPNAPGAADPHFGPASFMSPETNPNPTRTPNELGSGTLSEFSGLQDGDPTGTGYISSPSQSHSQSQSLSLSQSALGGPSAGIINPNPNQQSSRKSLLTREPTLTEGDNENDSDGEGEGAGSPPFSPSPPPRSRPNRNQVPLSIEDQVRAAMVRVEEQFRSRNCSVEAYLTSALSTDTSFFEKDLSFSLLDGIALICGVNQTAGFLQRFRVPVNPSSSGPSISSSGIGLGGGGLMGELEVETAALLLVQLAQELGLLAADGPASFRSSKAMREEGKDVTQRIIHLCLLLRLFASGNSNSGSESGQVSIGDLVSLLEDRWMVAVPEDGGRVQARGEIARCRYDLVLKAARMSSHPIRLLDEAVLAVTAKRRTDKLPPDTLSISDVQKVIASWHAGSDGGNRSDSENEGELAAAVVRLCRAGSTGSSAGTVTVSQLRSFLCRLCSFRSLQRKIQAWFRAVPTMYLSLLQLLNTASSLPFSPEAGPRSSQLGSPNPTPTPVSGERRKGAVSKKAFIDACHQSELPLSMAETVMLAELLSRRKSADTGTAAAGGRGGVGEVDISLLNKIKKGEFINAPLQ